MSANPTTEPKARWAAIVEDRIIPMPRRIVPALLIKEQAGIPNDRQLVRDYQSPQDETLADEELIDLSLGNVFRVIISCENGVTLPSSAKVAKMAIVVDDRFEIVIESNQTEDSLRRLFDLAPKVQLIRDFEGPGDKAILDGEVIVFRDGPVFLSHFDIEGHCKCGEAPPPCGSYLIRVDQLKITVKKPNPTGREILLLAGKNPSETMLNQKIGKAFEPVDLDAEVDLTACGIERFTTLPNEQSEGRPELRSDFALPEEDADLMAGSNYHWESVTDGVSKWLIIRSVKLPAVFVQHETSVAIQIPSGYPTTPLDMAYFYPPVRRTDGSSIPCTEASMVIDGKSWQRWSRHYTPANPWKPGEYNIMTHYLLALSWLDREAKRL